MGLNEYSDTMPAWCLSNKEINATIFRARVKSSPCLYEHLLVPAMLASMACLSNRPIVSFNVDSPPADPRILEGNW